MKLSVDTNDQIQFLLSQTEDIPDGGSKLFFMLALATKDQIDKFVSQYVNSHSYTTFQDLQVFHAIKAVHQEARDNNELRTALESIAIERGLAKADMKLAKKIRDGSVVYNNKPSIFY
jgi:hypothetical protein